MELLTTAASSTSPTTTVCNSNQPRNFTNASSDVLTLYKEHGSWPTHFKTFLLVVTLLAAWSISSTACRRRFFRRPLSQPTVPRKATVANICVLLVLVRLL